MSPKNKKFEKMEKNWGYHLTHVPKIMTRQFMVPEIWRVKDGKVISHLNLFFSLLPL